jgi:hypothetical protein
MSQESYQPTVTGVVGDRVPRLLSSDGTAGDVDFTSEHWTGVLAPLNDPAYSAQVTAGAGAVAGEHLRGGPAALFGVACPHFPGPS